MRASMHAFGNLLYDLLVERIEPAGGDSSPFTSSSREAPAGNMA